MCKTPICKPMATRPSATTHTDVLYRSPAGSLSYCTACRTFGLTFGSLHLGLEAEALLALAQLLERMSAVELKDDQCHMIRLGHSSASLLLDPMEMTDLRRIVRHGQKLAIGAQTAVAATENATASEAWVN